MNGFVFDKGIDITPVQSPMGFTYGAGVFGPEVEIRRLEDIRASLRDLKQGTGAGLLDRYGCRQRRTSCVAE